MNENENYRPAYIEFDVASDGTLMPENFGTFKDAEEAIKFIGGNFVSTNKALTVARHMDFVEKKLIREQYNDVLENILPLNEKKLSIAKNEFEQAKDNLKNAMEVVNATMTEVKGLAYEVKRGLKELKLDEQFTFQIPYKNRFYCYTFIDNQLRLVKISDIPEHEKMEIFNSSASNEKFIDENFGNNEQTEPQKGAKK